MCCLHLIRQLIRPPASPGRRVALTVRVCPEGWLGNGAGRVRPSGTQEKAFWEPGAQAWPAGEGERPRRLQTCHSVSALSLLQCGRVYRDSQHSGTVSAGTHGLYIAAVPAEDYRGTTGREFKSKWFAQVNAQGSWRSGLCSPASPLPNGPLKGRFKGAEGARCVYISFAGRDLVPEPSPTAPSPGCILQVRRRSRRPAHLVRPGRPANVARYLESLLVSLINLFLCI